MLELRRIVSYGTVSLNILPVDGSPRTPPHSFLNESSMALAR